MPLKTADFVKKSIYGELYKIVLLKKITMIAPSDAFLTEKGQSQSDEKRIEAIYRPYLEHTKKKS